MTEQHSNPPPANPPAQSPPPSGCAYLFDLLASLEDMPERNQPEMQQRIAFHSPKIFTAPGEWK